MKLAAVILFVLVLLMPAKLSAANTCPWLTEGTAAKALGGGVVPSAQISDSGEGFCTFSREEGESTIALRVLVQKAAQPSCPASSPKLKGIGNEAVTCTMKRSAEESVEMIVSRVRELHFTVSITIHKRGPKSTDVELPKGGLEQVAEQVAGNLF